MLLAVLVSMVSSQLEILSPAKHTSELLPGQGKTLVQQVV